MHFFSHCSSSKLWYDLEEPVGLSQWLRSQKGDKIHKIGTAQNGDNQISVKLENTNYVQFHKNSLTSID